MPLGNWWRAMLSDMDVYLVIGCVVLVLVARALVGLGQWMVARKCRRLEERLAQVSEEYTVLEYRCRELSAELELLQAGYRNAVVKLGVMTKTWS